MRRDHRYAVAFLQVGTNTQNVVHVHAAEKNTSKELHNQWGENIKSVFDLEGAVAYLVDPASGKNAKGRQDFGALSRHVDVLLMNGDDAFENGIGQASAGFPSWPGQRVQGRKMYIDVHQNFAVDALQGVTFGKSMKNGVAISPQMPTAHRSVLGQLTGCSPELNFIFGTSFPDTFADVRAVNKKNNYSIPLSMRFWSVKGNTTIRSQDLGNHHVNNSCRTTWAHEMSWFMRSPPWFLVRHNRRDRR